MALTGLPGCAWLALMAAPDSQQRLGFLSITFPSLLKMKTTTTLLRSSLRSKGPHASTRGLIVSEVIPSPLPKREDIVSLIHSDFGRTRFASRYFLIARRTAATATMAMISVVLLVSSVAFAGQGSNYDWVGTWGASPQTFFEDDLLPLPPTPDQFEDQTIRMIARISKGGDQVRVRFENVFGTAPLVLGAAHVALHTGGGNIDPTTDRTLTFGGSPSATIPPGAPALSDPVDLEIGDLAEVAVSIYLPASTTAETYHRLGRQTTYVSGVGNYTDFADFPTQDTTTTLQRFFLSTIDVLAKKNTRAIVTIGDSITDGFASTVDANNRWPDQLAERLLGEGRSRKLSVVNEGISGNRALNNEIGPNGLSRSNRDIVAQTGAAFVTLLLGINDIGFPNINIGGTFPFADQEVSADDIIQGYRQLIDRAHAKCLKIIGGTLTPFEGAGYYTAEGEDKRQAVNEFIRYSGEFDDVIDFDLAIRDPDQPSRMLPVYDSGDNLHPNDTGYDAMAEAIDLNTFQQPLRNCEAAN